MDIEVLIKASYSASVCAFASVSMCPYVHPIVLPCNILFVCPSARLCIRQCVFVRVCLCVRMFAMHPSVRLCARLCSRLYFCLCSVCASVFKTVCVSVCASEHPYVRPSVHISVWV